MKKIRSLMAALIVAAVIVFIMAIAPAFAVQPSGTKLVSKDTNWNIQEPYGKYPGGEIQYLNKGQLRLVVNPAAA